MSGRSRYKYNNKARLLLRLPVPAVDSWQGSETVRCVNALLPFLELQVHIELLVARQLGCGEPFVCIYWIVGRRALSCLYMMERSSGCLPCHWWSKSRLCSVALCTMRYGHSAAVSIITACSSLPLSFLVVKCHLGSRLQHACPRDSKSDTPSCTVLPKP